MRRYLHQLSTFLGPRSVDVADNALRQLARFALANTGIENVAEFRRDDIEDFKVWLAGRPGMKGKLLRTPTTSGFAPCAPSSSGSSFPAKGQNRTLRKPNRRSRAAESRVTREIRREDARAVQRGLP